MYLNLLQLLQNNLLLLFVTPLPDYYTALSEKQVYLDPYQDTLPKVKHHNTMTKLLGWHLPKESGSLVHQNQKLQHHTHSNFSCSTPDTILTMAIIQLLPVYSPLQEHIGQHHMLS